jgi:hypothetical protein
MSNPGFNGFNPWNSLAVGLGSPAIPSTKGAGIKSDVEQIPDIGPLPTDIGVMPAPGVVAPPQGPRTDLQALRQQFPFVPIMPFPSIITGVVLAAGVAQEIKFPTSGCVFILSGSGDYFASLQGNATIPSAADASPGSIYRPEFSWFYTLASGISVIAPNANTYVQAAIYVPADLPSFR